MRRGQISLMIIVMLLVLIVVGIILYAARTATTKRGEERVETQQRTAALLKPVQEYVTQCLDLSARSTIELLGKQGGVIYASQGGITPDPGSNEYVPDGQLKINYIIRPPEGNVGMVFFSNVPEYPWGQFPELWDNSTGAWMQIIPEFFQGYYGINKLPPLENADGSLQQQLETSVLEKTKVCFDWTVFEAQGIHIEPGEADLRVVFGTRGTSFLLFYPMNLTGTVTGATARIDSFAIELPVRLKAIHELAHAVVDKEVTNITFDPSSLVIDGVSVSIARDAYNFDDVFQFLDPASRLGGVQYVFQAARKNRAPALVWIPNSTSQSWRLCSGSTISFSGSSFSGEVSMCPPDSGFNGFSHQLRAYDPDEDTVTYRLSAGPGLQQVPPDYAVTSVDASFGKVQVLVEASDTEFTVPVLADNQRVFIPTS